jgi:hypothetical protein
MATNARKPDLFSVQVLFANGASYFSVNSAKNPTRPKGFTLSLIFFRNKG